MSIIRSVSILVIAVALCAFGCKSEPKNPYPQGYPQGYPQQQVPMPNQAMPGYPQPMQQQPAQPAQAVQAQNPMAGLAALGQAMGQMGGQPPAGGGQVVTPGAPAAALVPWAELAKALPLAAPGWMLQGQAEGETAAMMGIGVSTARCKLVQGTLQADIEILDNAMAAGMAGMGFAMMPTVDSSEQRASRLNFGAYPGLLTFHKKQSKADIVVIVSNRLMITVKVENTGSEQPAIQLAQMVNYQYLASLIGG
ncbi:MAG TPA: hypothetical protein VM285_00365 [Polyangia bacterium]|nr:hypothetical protein [Polyangia bacterium]